MERPFALTRREGVEVVEWRLGAGQTGQAFETGGRRITAQAAGSFHGATLTWDAAVTSEAPLEPAKTQQGLPALWSGPRLATLDSPVGPVRPRLTGGMEATEVRAWLLVIR